MHLLVWYGVIGMLIGLELIELGDFEPKFFVFNKWAKLMNVPMVLKNQS